MRATITLEDDVAAAVEQLRKSSDLGLSEAVNLLVRRGLTSPGEHRPFVQRTQALGLKVDVANIAEVFELLEGPSSR